MTARTLVPSTPDRTPLGIYRRKLDLARRLQDASDDHRSEGSADKADFYHELALEAMADAREHHNSIPRCEDCGHIQNGHSDPLYSHLETCTTSMGRN